MWRDLTPFECMLKAVSIGSAIILLLFIPFFGMTMEVKEEPYDIYYDRLYSDINDEDNFQDWVEDTQDSISDTIHDYSSSLDHYIGKNDEELPITNRSYLRLKLKSRYTHRDHLDLDASVKLKLDLPHTEKNWKLILDTDPDDFDRLEDKQRGISNGSDGSLSGAVGGVQLQGQQWGKWRTNLDLGLKIKLPLDPFARADLRRIDRLSHTWTSRIKQEIFYYDSKGPGALTSVNFYFSSQEDPSTILKLSSSAQYLDTDDNWEFVQQAEIFDRIGQDNLLQYSLGISADSTPNYSITNSWISLAWKHRLYSDWLYMTLTPELDFQDRYQYKVNPGIMLEIELFFTAEGGIDRLARKIPNPTN
ncbi:hypothetical protein [Photobacterium lutimaris]|uniref:Uncharacterized protein n=1 Tax=Photobacterium lutimaris TaxID=388278 RepID=A0A2T3J446_9GAMM|nr:hypothetical protein [Photobacterium lutimaris]PSU36077.1 hypothetical protein C9I99_03470 [Photobacterium lutimaris]TDR79181.1 hypothetical protein DFP78_101697 [Photobacterium lutimaris]